MKSDLGRVFHPLPTSSYVLLATLFGVVVGVMGGVTALRRITGLRRE